MTLRPIQLPSIADQLDELLILRHEATRPLPPPPHDPPHWYGNKRCSCGAPKSPRKEHCHNHPRRKAS
jgi:hypothetical protein